jgi:beta-lactamase class A
MTRRQFAIGLSATALGAAFGVRQLRAADATTFERECARIEATLQARMGVSVLDTATDQRVSYRGDERFPMCSTFKALLAAAVLKRVDAGEEDLSRRVLFETAELVTYSPVTEKKTGDAGIKIAELCHATVTVSDNTAANLLLKTVGGPPGITQLARSLGDTVTRLDRWETELNEATPGDPRDTTSPNAMAASLRALALGDALSERSRAQLAEWLIASTTGGARFRAGLPEDWRIGDKTGSGAFGSTNDVAVIWPPERKPLVIAMYVTETSAPADARNDAFVQVARVVKSELGL